MPRRSNQQRATDKLNVALSRISAAAEMMQPDHAAMTNAAMADALRKQITEAVDEGYAALADIKHALSAV